MKAIGIIPCHYEFSRFPGKSLVLINDMPMMWHVYQRALESNLLDGVCIAKDNERIVEVANKYYLNTVMTDDKQLELYAFTQSHLMRVQKHFADT